MASYAASDIVLLESPFTDTTGSKRRPALILLDTGDDDIVVARVTGQLSTAPQDVTLDEWQQAGVVQELQPMALSFCRFYSHAPADRLRELNRRNDERRTMNQSTRPAYP